MIGQVRCFFNNFKVFIVNLLVLLNLGAYVWDLYGLCSCYCVPVRGMCLQFLVVRWLFAMLCPVCFVVFILCGVRLPIYLDKFFAREPWLNVSLRACTSGS